MAPGSSVRLRLDGKPNKDKAKTDGDRDGKITVRWNKVQPGEHTISLVECEGLEVTVLVLEDCD